jgi:hypothetical protein
LKWKINMGKIQGREKGNSVPSYSTKGERAAPDSCLPELGTKVPRRRVSATRRQSESAS